MLTSSILIRIDVLLKSKLLEMQQRSNKAAETVAQYTKGTLENRVFFLNCTISGFLTMCYFSKLLHILVG